MNEAATGLQPTVGIVYPGELGSTLGRLLAASGLRVVAAVEKRSERTRRLAEEAGLSALSSLHEVAERADIVLSTVSPAAALPVAQEYLLHRPQTARPQLYVDLNSTAPETACQLEKLLRSAGLDFVDGAVHGLASRLPDRGTLYLSGAAAPRLAEVFGRALRVTVLGSEAGQASAFKMMISGLAKGVAALFAEMCLAGRRAGLLEELLVCYRQVYPGITELAERLLPTYTQHAARRAEEACAVEQTIRALGLRPCVAAGVREWTEQLAQARPGEALGAKTTSSDTLREMIEALAASGMLEMPAEDATHVPLLTSPGSGEETVHVSRPPISLA